MALEAGQVLSHYRLVEKIGEGGMGVVWRAEDTKLRRDVALKFLPQAVAGNPERLARFQREARMLAALNDSNVGAIFGMEQAGAEQFLVLEYVPGVSLAERLKKGSLPLPEALKICCDLARGLEAAHARGLVHRDLKPGNVQLTPEGTVKVLDFGLAKAFGDAVPADERSQQMTVTAATGQYTVIGTVPYMSPEQAAAAPVDKRTDIWAFGCVLFELLTGKRAFWGETVSNTLARIQGQDPDWTLLPAETPRAVRRLLERCLEKDLDRRLRDIGDVRIEIEDARKQWSRQDDVEVVRPQRRVRTATILLMVIAVAVSVVLILRPDRENANIPRLIHLTRVSATTRVDSYPRWSPDGRALVFHGGGTSAEHPAGADIWVAQVGAGSPLNRTEDHDGQDSQPSWSPDGRWIAFWSSRDGGSIQITPALSGNPRTVVESSASSEVIPGASVCWLPDGERIAYAVIDGPERAMAIVIHDLGTGQTERHPTDEPADVGGKGVVPGDLSCSPDGRFVAFVTSDDHWQSVSNLRVLSLETGQIHELTRETTGAWSPSWSPDSNELYFAWNRDGGHDLWRIKVGAQGGPGGDPQRITAGLRLKSAALGPDGRKVAYGISITTRNVWRVPLLSDRPATWADAEQLTFLEGGTASHIDVAPDGLTVYVATSTTENFDLGRFPASGGDIELVDTHPAADFNPAVSPDGRHLAFHSMRGGSRDLWLLPLGGGPLRRLTDDPGDEKSPEWSPDGLQIVFTRGSGIWRCSVEDCLPELVTELGGEPSWSPDGAWIAATAKGRVWRIPAAGGAPEPLTMEPSVRGMALWGETCWSADGREIYFITGRGAGNGSGVDIRAVRVDDRQERALTDFIGRPGGLDEYGLDTDGRYVYFTWASNQGDIWVADLAK